MAKLFLAFMAFGLNAYAWQAPIFIDAATNNIPTSFSTAAGSQAVTNLKYPRLRLCIFNETAGRIALNTETNSGAAPTEITHRIPASTSVCISGPFGKRIYIQSATGSAISAGVVHGWVD